MVTERHWSDQFGEHFEIANRVHDRLLSMKITKTGAGWSPSWDEVRRRMSDAVMSELANALSKEGR